MLTNLFALDQSTLKQWYQDLEYIGLYITLGLLVALFIICLIVKFKKPNVYERILKISKIIFLAYILLFIISDLTLRIIRMGLKEELDLNFFLIVIFLITSLIAVSISLLVKNEKVKKISLAISVAVLTIYGVILLFILPTVEGYAPLNFSLMYVLSIVLIVAIAVLTIFFGKSNTTFSQTKSIAYAGVCISLSFALSYFKVFSLPQGGSVTLASMLPLMIYSYIFGARKGVFAGIIYGILQCIQSPQIYEPMQVLLDYPIAFAGLGLAGITRNFKFLKGKIVLEFIIGMIICGLFRYASHVISGYFVFYSYATMDNALIYSIAYNSFVLVDIALCIIVGICLFSSKAFKKEFIK